QRVSYAETITQEDLKKHLYIYASDEFEGRDTGEPGQKKAVEYIKNHYQDINVQAAQGGDKYFQKVPMEINGIPSGSISIGDNDYTLGEGIITFSSIPNQTSDIVYAGYGIETDTYSDFKDIDVKGKYILIKIGEPKDSDGNYILSGSDQPGVWSNWRETLSQRVDIATEKGAEGVIYYDDEYFDRSASRYKYFIESQSGGNMTLKNDDKKIAYIFVNKDVATSIYPEIDNNDTAKALGDQIVLNIKNTTKDVDSENVVAFIKGKSKPDEYVVISSHLDHVGVDPNGDVFNGAD